MTLTLIARDATRYTLEEECWAGSGYLREIVFEGDEKREVLLPSVPPSYVRLAVRYLEATCGQPPYTYGAEPTGALRELAIARTLPEYPEALQYLYGYFNIASFSEFYQHLLLLTLRSGIVNDALLRDAEERVLAELSDRVLYRAAAIIPQKVNAVYSVPDARRYLRVRLERDTLALHANLLLHIERGQLAVRGQNITHGRPVERCYLTASPTANTSNYYFIDDRGSVFRGTIMRNFPSRRPLTISAPLQVRLEAVVTDIALNDATTFYLTEDGEVYASGANTSGFLIGSEDDEYLEEPRLLPLPFATSSIVAIPRIELVLFITTSGRLYALGQQVNFLPPLQDLNDAAPVFFAPVELALAQPIRQVSYYNRTFHTLNEDLIVFGQEAVGRCYYVGAQGLVLTEGMKVLDTTPPNDPDVDSDPVRVESSVVALTATPHHEAYRLADGSLRLYYRSSNEAGLVVRRRVTSLEVIPTTF